ncbi:ArsR family transcriptional regulator [Haloarcula marina]|uniref:ArsR family transcriptional regulator n=1 Tax=Haloarcula marina TaxID=2961574 RepID=UPI0020B63FF7|nr:ArsR family transcriptional regulator [Halomicroarcula marina]
MIEAVESPRAKLVLLYLDERGPATPREIADALDLPRLIVLEALEVLGDEGLVTQDSADRMHVATHVQSKTDV